MSLFHTCNGAAVKRSVSNFSYESPQILVSSPGWPHASPEKRGTPASIISMFIQVKNQTFSFHFFRVQKGGCYSRAWETELERWDSLHVDFCIILDMQSYMFIKKLCQTAPKDSCIISDRIVFSCTSKLCFKILMKISKDIKYWWWYHTIDFLSDFKGYLQIIKTYKRLHPPLLSVHFSLLDC